MTERDLWLAHNIMREREQQAAEYRLAQQARTPNPLLARLANWWRRHFAPTARPAQAARPTTMLVIKPNGTLTVHKKNSAPDNGALRN